MLRRCGSPGGLAVGSVVLTTLSGSAWTSSTRRCIFAGLRMSGAAADWTGELPAPSTRGAPTQRRGKNTASVAFPPACVTLSPPTRGASQAALRTTRQLYLHRLLLRRRARRISRRPKRFSGSGLICHTSQHQARPARINAGKLQESSCSTPWSSQLHPATFSAARAPCVCRLSAGLRRTASGRALRTLERAWAASRAANCRTRPVVSAAAARFLRFWRVFLASADAKRGCNCAG